MDSTVDAVVPGLSRDNLSEMYWAAEAWSQRGQRNTVRWSAAQLILLAGGALLGGIDTVVGGIQLGALAAAVALTVSLIPAVWLARTDPQRAWYRGRAGAESINTLAWKYAVRADPYAGDDSTAAERLTEDLARIRDDLREIPWPTGEAITPAMRALRAEPLTTRRDAYLSGRIDIEGTWYRTKAESFERIAKRWAAIALVATGLGLVAGFARAFGMMAYDGLGAASAVAAGATAWLQLKQFRPLVTAYSLTADELAAARAGLVDLDDEAVWARQCHNAEEAISREHIMWLARREAT